MDFVSLMQSPPQDTHAGTGTHAMSLRLLLLIHGLLRISAAITLLISPLLRVPAVLLLLRISTVLLLLGALSILLLAKSWLV